MWAFQVCKDIQRLAVSARPCSQGRSMQRRSNQAIIHACAWQNVVSHAWTYPEMLSVSYNAQDGGP